MRVWLRTSQSTSNKSHRARFAENLMIFVIFFTISLSFLRRLFVNWAKGCCLNGEAGNSPDWLLADHSFVATLGRRNRET